MYSLEVIQSIKEDAIARFPEESCGVVVLKKSGEVAYKSLPNVADDPLTSFHIDERFLLTYEPSILAIIHSHPNGPDFPSEADMVSQVSYNIPFGIVSTDGVGCLEPFFWGDSVARAPLLGRGFRYGVTDCYSLIRDYYKEILDVRLREYPRDWEWWSKGGSMYEDYFAKENFTRIDEHQVQEHDVFLAQIRSSTPNHGGVYVGNNLILHHLTSRLPVDSSRLSRREPIGTWTKFICGFWIRHESQVSA